MISPLFTFTIAGSKGGMSIEGPDSNGSSSETLKVTTSCETFSGGSFIIFSPLIRIFYFVSQNKQQFVPPV
jgi:hypothetical protein